MPPTEKLRQPVFGCKFQSDHLFVSPDMSMERKNCFKKSFKNVSSHKKVCSYGLNT
jgi:hypothetical protein